LPKLSQFIRTRETKKDIENYRPIANLCAGSKVFEKFNLKCIMEIYDTNGLNLTGESHHGFKKGHSTSTLSAKIQSFIAHALDDDECVLLASLGLNSEFDLVNVELLLKRLQIIGLLKDVIYLISARLNKGPSI
jgi:hypothetical protein